MILAFASAAHGRNLLGQWYIVAIAASLYGIVWLMASGIFAAIAAFIFVPAYWLLFRRGAQAQLEMRVMDTGHPLRARLRDVLKAHYYIGWLTCLGLWLFNYSTPTGKRLGWEHQWAMQGHVRGKKVRVDEFGRVHEDDKPFWDCRRPTEFLTGLTGDIIIISILFIIGA